MGSGVWGLVRLVRRRQYELGISLLKFILKIKYNFFIQKIIKSVISQFEREI